MTWERGRWSSEVATAQPSSDDLDTWHVQYRDDDRHHVGRHLTPELAIEAACRLMDDGLDVYGIGTGAYTDSVGKDEIGRVYALWVQSRGTRAFIHGLG